jgi:hypothetical protein
MPEPTANTTNAAADLLAMILCAPGLLDNTDDLYRAGAVADRIQCALPEKPKAGDEVGGKAWMTQEFTVVLSAKEKATAKKAVEKAANKGMVGAGKQVNQMLALVGAVPE